MMLEPTIVGFTTATMDMLHEGHVRYLQTCRAMCDHLIVGITDDSTARREKRPTMCSYTHRAAVVGALACVDSVVANSGQTKRHFYTLLRFNRLFTSEEYHNSVEFVSFEREYPHIPVIYLPRHPNVSSSNWANARLHNFAADATVLANGISGPLRSFRVLGQQIVAKPICIGYREARNGANSYNMTVPPPRNYKTQLEPDEFPNISGVNAYREILMLPFLENQDWYPCFKVTEMFEDESATLSGAENPINALTAERAQPIRTLWLFQRYAGLTLPEFMNEVPQAEKPDVFRWICNTVFKHIATLAELGIVHGDVHAGNICILNRTVSLVDFGWCMHHSFALEPDEEAYYKECLATNFDWTHFLGSLSYFELDGLYIRQSV